MRSFNTVYILYKHGCFLLRSFRAFRLDRFFSRALPNVAFHKLLQIEKHHQRKFLGDVRVFSSKNAEECICSVFISYSRSKTTIMYVCSESLERWGQTIFQPSFKYVTWNAWKIKTRFVYYFLTNEILTALSGFQYSDLYFRLILSRFFC